MAAEPALVLDEHDVRRGIKHWCYAALEYPSPHVLGRAALSVYRYAHGAGDAWVERLEFQLRQGFSANTSEVSVFYAAGMLRFIGSDVRFSVRLDTTNVTQAVLDRTLESVRRRLLSVTMICNMFKTSPDRLEA